MGPEALREFEMRLIFRVTSDDSMQLINSSDGSELGPYRAIFFNEDTEQLEKFRPYKLPSETWRRWATQQLRAKK